MPEENDRPRRKSIVVKRRRTPSSSFSRMMGTIGRNASARAIREAEERGVPVSYIEDGKIVTVQSPDSKKSARE